MQEYTTRGTIIAQPYGRLDLRAGSVCVVLIDDIYHRITLLHTNGEGDWIAEGDYNGLIDRYDTLLKICFLNGEYVYPIAMKHWTKILKRSMLYDKELHDFIIKPLKFKEGKNMQTCTECSASFKANRSQPLCKDCCTAGSVAYLGSNLSPKTSKVIKEPQVNLPQVMQLARIAYEMGKSDKSEEEFIEWLENKDLWQ